MVNALLLKPVAYQHGERWASVLGATLGDSEHMSGLTLDDVLEFQQRLRSFDVFGWIDFENYNLTAPGQPQFLNGVQVTPSLPNSIGVNPQSGQWFRDAREPLAVISYSLWQRLGGDPGFVGKTITLSGRIYTVSGIMPPDFSLPPVGVSYFSGSKIDVWIPLDPTSRVDPARGTRLGLARLRPGVTMAQADVEAKRLAAEMAKRDLVARQSFSARVDSLQWLSSKDIRPLLLLLFGAAELLLLITCANVGGLLVARSVVRARETAVRVALGAGLRQLASQYFLEGLAVALPGATGGLLFSVALVPLLVSFAPPATARASEIVFDWRVCLFALGTALFAGALTSVAPLWQAARTSPNEVLTEGVRASAGARSRRLSQSLVVAEVALAFVLLAVSAVLVAELRRLTHISPGFDPEHLLTFQLTFSPEETPGMVSRVAYQDRLLESLRALPGVSGAALVNQLPLNCCLSTAIFPEGQPPGPDRGDRLSWVVASPDYLRTMRIPLRGGRALNERDTSEKVLTVMINQATVKRYWPDRDPIGALGHFNSPTGSPFQVVGVVGDVKNNSLGEKTVPEIYLPAAVVTWNHMNFVLRSTLPEKTLVPEVRRAIQNVNPGQPIHEVKMMSEIVRDSVALKRMASYVMTFFALAALLMASIGTYGVVSYGVRQRTVELGTRMALGAVSRDVLALVVGSGLKMAAYGVAIGAVVSVAAARVVLSQFDIENPSFLPLVLSAVIIAVIAMAASFFPAWGATLLSPMVAIRNEPGSMWDTARHGMGQLFEGLFRAVAGDEEILASDQSLTTEFIEASRGAASFREAIRAALESLRGSMGAQSALLLESVSEEYRATAAAPGGDVPACSIPKDGLLARRLRSHALPLPLAAEDFDVWRRWAEEFKPQHLAEVESLRQTGARMAAPLRTNKEMLGVLLLGTPTEGEYDAVRTRLLRDCANHFALMLENARLTSRIVEHERLQRDLALAAEVQKRLLPRQSLDTPIAALAAVSIPARSVGGDYYDFLDLPGHRTAIALADVAGKGVAAALIMSVVQASLRVIASEPDISLPQLAAKVKEELGR